MFFCTGARRGRHCNLGRRATPQPRHRNAQAVEAHGEALEETVYESAEIEMPELASYKDEDGRNEKKDDKGCNLLKERALEDAD